MGSGSEEVGKAVAERFSLSPLQVGMLFHAVSGDTPGVDVLQVVCDLPEELDTVAFAAAWQRVAQRHTACRTRFNCEDQAEPYQEVLSTVTLPVARPDWRQLSATQQHDARERLLAGERRQGFDLRRPPLMRLTLARLGEAHYQLFWTLHHILMDAHSLGLVMRDVFLIYEALRAGQEPPANPAIRFRDHVAWLREHAIPNAESFWRTYLSDLAQPTELTLAENGAEPEADEALYAETAITLAEAEMSALRQRAQTLGVTVNTLIHGAWALLLRSYSGSDDVVFGILRSGRRHSSPGAHEGIGLYVNTLPLRAQLTPGRQTADWLRELRQHAIAARPFEHTPLAEIQRWTSLQAGQPLVTTLVSFQDPAWDETLRAQEGDWAYRRFRVINQPSYPLALDAYGGRELRLHLCYDRRRFATSSMIHMLAHYRHLLQNLATSPEQQLGNLQILEPAERQQILVDWNRTSADYPANVRVHEMVELQAERLPHASAVHCSRGSLSYRELNQRANRLGHYLRSLGIGPGMPVGVCLQRSTDLIVAWLAVWKAGGAYVPLDPTYPKARLDFMIADAQMPVLLTHQAFLDQLPAAHIRILCLDGPQVTTELKAFPPTNLVPIDALTGAVNKSANGHSADRMEAPAYVIYTSGSTGQPKGVMVPHRGLNNLVAWTQRAYGIDVTARATQLASPAFDAAVWETWPYLTAGASLHIPDEDTRLHPEALLAWFAAREITHCFLPTPLAEAVLEAPRPADLKLKWLLTGGDRLRRCPKAGTSFRIVNHYGPTEYSVVTTAGEVTPDAEGLPTIGRPIANTQVYVLDTWHHPVPTGVAGQLHVAGSGLALGYWHRPELTAEKFVPNPFSPEGNSRLYCTGDLVRYAEDGTIDFIGRTDHQVKVRGYRIELGDLEATLCAHQAVRAAVGMVHESSPGNTRLVAYVALKENGSIEENALRKFLRQHLPDFMVPEAIVMLKQLPLTTHGKIDRAALPLPQFEDKTFSESEPPHTPTEKMLAETWSEVLHLPVVRRHANFFGLGGHSLLIAQVITRIERKCGYQIAARDLFAYPVLADLAQRIDRAILNKQGRGSHSAMPITKSGETVVSFGQERLWFLEQLQPGLPLYNVPVALHLTGPLDRAALATSLNEIVRRHTALRTSLATRRGKPVPVINSGASIPLAEEDLSGLPTTERRAHCDACMRAEAANPVPLDNAPPLRARLFKLGVEEHRLVLTFHHAAFDGWSLDIFYREWAELYTAHISQRQAALPELPIQYSDFAAWQRQQLASNAWNEQLAYWQQKLGGKVPLLELPGDHPRPPQPTHRGAALEFSLEHALYERVKQIAARESVTPFMLLLAAFKAWLFRYSGQMDLLVGTPVAGRTRTETDGLIGLFLNTLVMRTQLAAASTFQELLSQVRQTALEAFAHQDVPFEHVVEAVHAERDLSRSPFFQVMFNLHPAPLPPHAAGALRVENVPTHNGTSKFDLTMNLADEGGRFSGTLEYSSDLFAAETMRRWLEHFKVLLAGALAEPGQTIGRLPLLTQAERRQLLVDWNATAAPFPAEKCIHELFAEQAQRTPDAVAVVHEDKTLTYRELDQRANRLAHHLRNLGVGPNVRVGIRMTRSAEMVVALYAAHKAGGAYVPMDPAYPSDRLKFMLEDAQVTVLLTQAELLSSLPETRAAIVSVDVPEQFHTGEPNAAEAPPQSGVTPEHLAYVIYTSGSTGKPKGVMVQHRNVVNFFTGMDAVIHHRPGVWLGVTSISFDISVLELFWTLTRGFKVIIYSAPSAGSRPHGQGHSVNGSAPSYTIRDLIERHAVTHLQCTPSLAGMMAGDPKTLTAIRQLKQVLLGGEPLPAALVQRLQGAGEILNMYGPTETTVWSTVHPVTRNSGSIRIGRPIANTKIYILDAQGEPAPVGVAGELLIGGAGVTRGYLNRPELTSERFIPNPFEPETGERLYRTGDLARYCADGTIEFLGRLDHQVKLRGFRIELGEIEAAMRDIPGIGESVVSIWTAGAEDKRLVGYYVSQDGSEKPAAELRRFLKGKLPEYMVPAHFVHLPALPLTPNGKVDRKVLPAPDVSQKAPAPAILELRNPMERQIAECWQDLLRSGAIGLDDNFFDLGGHSLLAVQSQARLEERLGIKFPVIKIFQNPTVRSLARCLGKNPNEHVPAARIQDRAQKQRAAFGLGARKKEMSL